jgi:hypothetical protein
MAAPIQRYGDPRLYGTTFVKPLDKSYQWIRTASNPLHPKCCLIMECAVRVLKLVTGTFAIAITCAPALVGRSIQVIHYHCLSREARAHPQAVAVAGMHLPKLEPCPMPKPKKFHGTSRSGAIGILRWSFDAGKTKPGSKMADAVYVSASDVVSAAYGVDQLVLSLDLRPGEIAYASDSTLGEFTRSIGQDLSDKKVMAAVRELYYQNGYRAVKYDLDHPFGRQEAWAVYDVSCISILEVRPSPDAVPLGVGGGGGGGVARTASGFWHGWGRQRVAVGMLG